MPPWHPSQGEIDGLMVRAANRLMQQTPRIDWVPLAVEAAQREPADADRFCFIGWLVGLGEPEQHADRLVFWHPDQQQSRLMIIR
jgi:hypothetical protein